MPVVLWVLYVWFCLDYTVCFSPPRAQLAYFAVFSSPSYRKNKMGYTWNESEVSKTILNTGECGEGVLRGSAWLGSEGKSWYVWSRGAECGVLGTATLGNRGLHGEQVKAKSPSSPLSSPSSPRPTNSHFPQISLIPLLPAPPLATHLIPYTARDANASCLSICNYRAVVAICAMLPGLQLLTLLHTFSFVSYSLSFSFLLS